MGLGPNLQMVFGIIIPKLLIDFGTQPKITIGFWEAHKIYRILGYFYPQNMLVILGRFDLVIFLTEGAAGGGEATC